MLLRPKSILFPLPDCCVTQKQWHSSAILNACKTIEMHACNFAYLMILSAEVRRLTVPEASADVQVAYSAQLGHLVVQVYLKQ